MKKKFKTTPTQKKADRYIRSAKAQIRTKAEKRGYAIAKKEDKYRIALLKLRICKLEKELEKVQLALKGEIA